MMYGKMQTECHKLLLQFHLGSELSSELERKERIPCRYGYKKAYNAIQFCLFVHFCGCWGFDGGFSVCWFACCNAFVTFYPVWFQFKFCSENVYP